MTKTVTLADLHAAIVAQRKAVARAESLRRQIARGTKWAGADQQAQADAQHHGQNVRSLQAAYDAEHKPLIRAATDAVRSATAELANKTTLIGQLQCDIALAQCDAAKRQAYLATLTSNLTDDGDDAEYSPLIDGHLGSEREKLATVEERISDLQAELKTVESQLPALKKVVAEKVAALQSLAV